jgi:hypothetical protein
MRLNVRDILVWNRGAGMRAFLGAFLSVALGFYASTSTGDSPKPQSSGCLDNNDCLQAAYRKSIDSAKIGSYMEASFGLLGALGVDAPDKIRDPDVFDQWSQVWSAMTGESAANLSKDSSRHVTPEEIAAIESAQGRPAIREIVDRAKHTRVVILDEDHLTPRDRAFGLEVARSLRPLGYTILAAEALTRDKDDSVSIAKMQTLSKDGYVRRSSGYYLNDPVFADYLRQAIAMGYHLVSYESAGFTEETTEEGVFVRREQEQTENIVHRALEENPDAKVLIYCGFHHAAKTELASDTVRGRLYMTARLKSLTGIEPLVIDQAEFAQAMYRPDVDINAIVSKKAKTESVVLMDGAKPLVVGLLTGAVDLQVVHPRTHIQDGRPDWLAILGRRPVEIPASLLPKSGTRLIQAFLANEAGDAIPIDQVLVTAGQPVPKLMLPKVSVRYAYQDDPRISGTANELQPQTIDGMKSSLQP